MLSFARGLWTYCAMLSLNLNAIADDDACSRNLVWDVQGSGCRCKDGLKMLNGGRQKMARKS